MQSHVSWGSVLWGAAEWQNVSHGDVFAHTSNTVLHSNSRDPPVPAVGRYHMLTVMLMDWAFSKDSRCTGARAICSYFSNTHNMPSVGWAQEGSPSHGHHTWLWSAGKWGGLRGTCFPAPHHQHNPQPWTCQCEHLHCILMLAFQIRILPMNEIIHSYTIKSLCFHIKSTCHENHCSQTNFKKTNK